MNKPESWKQQFLRQEAEMRRLWEINKQLDELKWAKAKFAEAQVKFDEARVNLIKTYNA